MLFRSDVVYTSDTILMEELEKEVRAARHEFFRYGVALDQTFQTALLEAELNGAKIYMQKIKEQTTAENSFMVG